jgi:hypothetical protein
MLAGLARGVSSSVRYAIGYRTKVYKVSSATILENVPAASFITVYLADSAGGASTDVISDVAQAIEGYVGMGVTQLLRSATPVGVDIKCLIKLSSGIDYESIRAATQSALSRHLSSYTFPGDGGLSKVTISNLEVLPGVIQDLRVSFQKSSTRLASWDLLLDPFTPSNRFTEDVEPVVDASVGEIIRPGVLEVYIEAEGQGDPGDFLLNIGDFYTDLSTGNRYRCVAQPVGEGILGRKWQQII